MADRIEITEKVERFKVAAEEMETELQTIPIYQYNIRLVRENGRA